MIRKLRTQLFYGLVALSAMLVVLGQWMPGFLWGLLATVPLVILGLWDLLQPRHNLLRNYPIIGHLRYLIEDTGAELRQYIVESNTEGKPFSRDQRSLMYQRAKGVSDKKPFGTELNVYAEGYTWLTHSMAPRPVAERPVQTFRIQVGGDACRHPYSASIYNISAMSFGSLSGSAIRALNKGAKLGDFAHNTGEGGVSRYHEEFGGDLIWQIGTGYFGCRTADGDFDADRFAAQATHRQIRMIEVKISQGAKPGHGGILPAAKITPEIAEARGVPRGADCVSPAYHRAFGTPIELLEFMARLRELSGGKPVGFKLCVGRPDEFFAVCKAIVQTGLAPDFITVDGAEGGTGAAPIEFSDHIGLPGREGILLVHNALVGINVRESIRIIAAGKLISGFDIAVALALGADLCNTARGFMFALGCIQAQTCHTNQCPVGVATQRRSLQRALVVSDKAQRVWNFHRKTVAALAEVVAAAGLDDPAQLQASHIFQRTSPAEIKSFDQLYTFYEPGQLLDDRAGTRLQRFWDIADASRFGQK